MDLSRFFIQRALLGLSPMKGLAIKFQDFTARALRTLVPIGWRRRGIGGLPYAPGL